MVVKIVSRSLTHLKLTFVQKVSNRETVQKVKKEVDKDKDQLASVKCLKKELSVQKTNKSIKIKVLPAPFSSYCSNRITS